jgi:hypothetical protein
MTKSVHDGFTLDDAKRTAREYAATAGFVTDRGAPNGPPDETADVKTKAKAKQKRRRFY